MVTLCSFVSSGLGALGSTGSRISEGLLSLPLAGIFFKSWESLGRTAITALLAYILLVFLLRVSGKRTLSKMNAFDFVVTIALGSTLATVILNNNVPLADGVLAFFLLIFFQLVITWLSARFKAISRLVKSQPSLLLYRGELLRDMMRSERIDEDEIYAIIREKGLASFKEVDAVVLETDGSLTVIKNVVELDNETMGNLRRPPRLEE